MTSRFRLASVVVCSITLAGCSDAFNAGSIEYKPSPRATTDLKDKPQLQAAIAKALADLFGESPQKIKVPAGANLPEGGRRLANYEEVDGKWMPIAYNSARTGELTEIGGGYGLYRRYCLHCHGVQGGGDGPTADFLYPRPRDYRLGIFKFTSTAPTNAKPTRSDLLKTIKYGLHGTSMPAFEALMTGPEIEQVVDYVVFLSMRGEVEKNLIDEAKVADKDDPSALPADTIKEIADGILNTWKVAEGQVVGPKARRTPPTRESVLRGRDIFLAINTTGQKVACTDCHGAQGIGNGTSFIEKPIFDKIVFGTFGTAKITDDVLNRAIEARYKEVQDEQAAQRKAERLAENPDAEDEHGHESGAPSESFEAFKTRMLTAWKPGSLDDWGNPLRPANLNLGVYKGGRRPIDLYWRINKGINGAKMPSHASLLPDEQTWDVVNFVLALPYDPGLLRDAEALRKKAGVGATAPAPVASSGPAATSVASGPR